MDNFQMRRLGQIMASVPGDPRESEGVLNPGAVRGPDGELYLFPRLVAQGNYSRIGIARVRFSAAGEPCGVERLGIALEPDADYERRPDGGGCEDPRVTYVEPLGQYVMTYTALSPDGPRIALAVSEDLCQWQRLGLATFEPHEGLEFNGVDNKDASVFPQAIPDPSGQPALALVHRPLFPGTTPEVKVRDPEAGTVDRYRESIWISYRSMAIPGGDASQLSHFTSHHRLACPEAPWEKLKIGCGTPPVRIRDGWLIVYHGVSDVGEPTGQGYRLCYSAGVMVLSMEQPSVIRYRSARPVLVPVQPQERRGKIADIVFPTGIDRRDDLGWDCFDVYYGMADHAIGVASLTVPDLGSTSPAGQ
jgi:beta-1,2-mannobiose phosphorylase / 1,2-beta-oligomannan phosphorylase